VQNDLRNDPSDLDLHADRRGVAVHQLYDLVRPIAEVVAHKPRDVPADARAEKCKLGHCQDFCWEREEPPRTFPIRPGNAATGYLLHETKCESSGICILSPNFRDLKMNWSENDGHKLASEELERGYWVAVPLPPTMKISIANIVVLWGQYEREFNTYFEMLFADSVCETERELKQGYRKKLNRYVRLYKERFASCPEILKLFDATACPLSVQQQRNEIVHGRFQISYNEKTNSHALEIIPNNFVKAIPEATQSAQPSRFTAQDLDLLGLTISRYCGEFGKLFSFGMLRSIEGGEALHDFLVKYHPHHKFFRMIEDASKPTRGFP